ncbi:MAG TPA: hypothetical protein VLB04_06965 [Methanotrichaceae archaeon]|nr:hypothetical protein [Methanotrichaceae archaeon]
MAREKIPPEELSIEPISARFNLSPFDSVMKTATERETAPNRTNLYLSPISRKAVML